MQIRSHVMEGIFALSHHLQSLSPKFRDPTLRNNLDEELSPACVRCQRHSEDSHTISRRGYWMPISQRDSFLFASLPPDKRNPGAAEERKTKKRERRRKRLRRDLESIASFPSQESLFAQKGVEGETDSNCKVWAKL